MVSESLVLLVLDLVGTFAFAVNGALTGVRVTRLDIVGVVVLGLITGLGGGTVRDVLLGKLPPSTFVDWRYLLIATVGGLLAFVISKPLGRLARTITILDAVGLSTFAVLGASKALALGFGPVQAAILGMITAVGGGTIRDVLIRRVPTVLQSELYAIPALAGAGIIVALSRAGITGIVPALGAAAVCFVLRMLGVRYGLNAPEPPGTGPAHPAPDEN